MNHTQNNIQQYAANECNFHVKTFYPKFGKRRKNIQQINPTGYILCNLFE